jgi:hypothetical protein
MEVINGKSFYAFKLTDLTLDKEERDEDLTREQKRRLTLGYRKYNSDSEHGPSSYTEVSAAFKNNLFPEVVF